MWVEKCGGEGVLSYVWGGIGLWGDVGGRVFWVMCEGESGCGDIWGEGVLSYVRGGLGLWGDLGGRVF